MKTEDLYKTIRSPSSGIYREKGSRFLAFSYPVSHEEEIAGHLSGLRKKYHDARHHCYAWRLGPGKDRYRTSDDREPSGTAGRPIFGQIRSRDLTDVLVVVVRYFGGTLLGAGGLIHAYRTAASEALDRSSVIEKKVFSRLEVVFGYGSLDRVMAAVKVLDLEFVDQQYDLDCKLILNVWNRRVKTVTDRLSRIEGCRVSAS